MWIIWQSFTNHYFFVHLTVYVEHEYYISKELGVPYSAHS